MDRQKSIEVLQDTILSLEKQRKSRIFCLLHAPDGRPNKGQPHICYHEYRQLVEHREDFKKIDRLEVLVQSPGGHANIAYQLATFFRRHCKELHYLVPMEAKSAATILCLNADKVIMGRARAIGRSG